jgi:hypothetical protein
VLNYMPKSAHPKVKFLTRERVIPFNFSFLFESQLFKHH